ncbi:hypothetical protein TI04_03645 [Achromatium sp. WMS2]|nr:hypothetical protein TI04_03645 [Achromatium sp. WMS2]
MTAIFAVADQQIPPHPSEATWILVDTKKLVLEVFRGSQKLISFEQISIGQGGAAEDRVRGDKKTPIGRFRISRIDRTSKFHIFMELDYPSRIQVERALRNGMISREDYERIRNAWREGEETPQDTPLGGHIGIHGLGTSNAMLHAMSNWTQGCVALTNSQIDELITYVDVSTLVVVV